jgi:hypothetical protein
VEILFCPPRAGKKDWSDSPVLAVYGKDAPKSLGIEQRRAWEQGMS